MPNRGGWAAADASVSSALMGEPFPTSPESLDQGRREQGVELLRRLVSLGKLDLSAFESALDEIMSAVACLQPSYAGTATLINA